MSGPAEIPYPGKELELFAHAHNWKNYWRELVSPYLKGAVLEVGAGIGTNTRLLRNGEQDRWVCLEPDGGLLEQAQICLKSLPFSCEFVHGTMGSLHPKDRFDAMLYLDVLEHIADDASELQSAASHLNVGGRLIVLGPAHQKLYSAFDAAIGHCRRYDRRLIEKAGAGTGLRLERFVYLDSCGLLASLANRLLLRQSLPTYNQILFWDGKLIPISRRCDRLLGHRVGKSVFAVWTRT